MTARLRVEVVIIWLAVAACGPGANQDLESPIVSTGSQSLAAWLALPIAPELSAVSAGDLSAEASAALDACWITDTKGELVATFGLAAVAGMAKVTPARDAAKYVPLWGNEPEIQTDEPAWIIRLSGERIFPTFKLRDPTCVVVGGVRNWYSTGASNLDGEWRDDPPPPNGLPTLRLPPLAP